MIVKRFIRFAKDSHMPFKDKRYLIDYLDSLNYEQLFRKYKHFMSRAYKE